MLLYDIFGTDGTFDSNIALPSKGKMGDRAVCKNGPKEVLVWNGRRWVSEAAASLGARGGSVKSKKKAAAARENGRKGGRPRLDP